MDRQAIREMLREVLGPNTELIDHPKWVGMHCPLSRWTHEHGADTSPSAGISVKEDGTSIFNCYVCGRGTVPWFLRQMEKYTGESYKKIINTIEHGEFLGGSLPEWGDSKVKKHVETFLDADTYLDLYDSAVGHWYFGERAEVRGETCLTDETIETLQLKLDPGDSRGDERILFPVFSRDGGLYGFTGRAVYDKVEPRVRDYHGLPKARVLLGLHLIMETDTLVVVVEGPFDYAIVAQYGYPVVATLHSGLTPEQAQHLIDLGKPVVFMYDNDAAGEKATDVATEALKEYLPISRVTYPKRKRWKGGKATCPKDPASCTEDEVISMIDKAIIL